MAEIVIKVPKRLEKNVLEVPDLEGSVQEFVKMKVLERELNKSKALQRLLFEALASKNKMTGKDAKTLSTKMDLGLLKELKEKNLI